jgi:Glycosyl transferase family 2
MMFAKSVVGKLVPLKLRSKLREQHVSMNITHLYGPRAVQLSKDEAAVICVLRNGEYYIDSFIEHYSKLGFRHFFFLDNGSSDETLSLIRNYHNVSVWKSTLPINSNQRLFKKYLAERSIRGGWCLDADIDEFFDFPFSDVINLQQFLAYLNQGRYTALITQLLDMFSDSPLSCLTNERKEDVKAVYRYYDISNITRTDYRTSAVTVKYGDANELADKETALYWGGIRKTLYGNNCLLTKHSLFFPEAGIDLFPHIHFVNKARVADVSGVMLHYKLTSNAMAVARQNQNNFTENSKTYAAFISALEKDSNRKIRQDTGQKFISATDLAKRKFLLMSSIYEEYATAGKLSNLSECLSTNGSSRWPTFKA